MENQNSSTLPEKFQEKFLLKRIGDEEIELSLDQYNKALEAIVRGDRFIKIRKHIVMVNSIKSIDPKWGEDNIPPRPRPFDYNLEPYNRSPDNDRAGREWDKYFKNKIEMI